MHLILGLGNPGKKYQNTRHNIGFAAIDFLFEEWLEGEGSTAWHEEKKFQAEISEGNLNGEKIILAKPQTFMNNSGTSTSALVNFYKVEPKNIVVIHDDLDIAFGEIKVQTDRSSAGHNGIKSIIERLGTQAFTRVRVGIGKADRAKQGEAADYVLNKFGLVERLKLKVVKNKILEEIKNNLTSTSSPTDKSRGLHGKFQKPDQSG